MSEAPLTEAAAHASGGATGGVKGDGFVSKQVRAAQQRFVVSEGCRHTPCNPPCTVCCIRSLWVPLQTPLEMRQVSDKLPSGALGGEEQQR